MAKKNQAGLELLAIMIMLLIFTFGVNNLFFRLNSNALSVSSRERLVSKCLDINTLVSKILSEPGLSARISLPYSLAINSTARLITIFSGNDSYACGLITARLKNSTGNAEFNLIAGDKLVINNGKEVVII